MSSQKTIRVAELFAGVGGFRLGLDGYDNPEHPDFYIYTPDGKIRTYTVFAAGEVSAVSENYEVDFASDEEYEQFLGKCSADSAYPVDVELNAQSQIITLSTCTNDGDANRFVVRGVLTAID